METVEVAKAADHRRTHVQDLSKYRSILYRQAMERLVRNREESVSKADIQDDLIMRQVLNHTSKFVSTSEGPLIIVVSMDNDVYQFTSPNDYILQNLGYSTRSRKLSLSEIERYIGEFWHVSNCLESHGRRIKEQERLDLKRTTKTIAWKQAKDTSLERRVKRKKVKKLHTQRVRNPVRISSKFTSEAALHKLNSTGPCVVH